MDVVFQPLWLQFSKNFRLVDFESECFIAELIKSTDASGKTCAAFGEAYLFKCL